MSTETSSSPIEKDDLTILSANEKIRQKIIKAHIRDGNIDVDDPEVTSALLRALKDSDSTVFKKTDLAIKAKSSQASAETLQMVARALQSVKPNDTPRLSDGDLILPEEYIPGDIVPGEVDQGVVEVDLETIIAENSDDD